jgi:preprotein translocase subunit YajC
VNGGSSFFLLIIAFGFLYFVLVRPQRRRQQQARQMISAIKPGDEVVTAGGIYGTVTELVDDDDVLLEIAPELRVRVARRAIGAVVHREDEPEAVPGAELPQSDTSGGADTDHRVSSGSAPPEPPTAENGG